MYVVFIHTITADKKAFSIYENKKNKGEMDVLKDQLQQISWACR